MQKRKYVKIALAILVGVGCFLFLISQIRFEKERDRNVVAYCLAPDLKEQIEGICTSYDTLEKTVKECSKLTCEMLSFSAKNDIPKGKANCVGYAQLTSSIINYAFQVKKLPYRAKPVVGKVYLFGIDLNNVAQKILPKKHRSFFKDHDFVEVVLGDRTIYIDSSLQDLTGLTFSQISNQ
ncbi:MAG: hypothetical protein K2M01_06940 [Paramuribaculum sp.]|nr:hypothetical protein [Paramuribaculum sp.]